MTLDKTLNTITVENKNTEFHVIINEMQKEVKTKTGYTGNFSEKSIDNYFSAYTSQPILDKQQKNVVGIEVSYAIRDEQVTKSKSRPASGTGPATQYKF